jgi:gas vesicle protein
MAREENNGISVAWFLVGTAIGAAVALLYAPQSGKDTRRLIAKKTEEGREILADSSKEVLDRGKELFDKGRELADEAADIFERGRKLVRG